MKIENFCVARSTYLLEIIPFFPPPFAIAEGTGFPASTQPAVNPKEIARENRVQSVPYALLPSMSQKLSFRDRFNLSRMAIYRSRIAVFFWIFVAVVGFFAFGSLKYALFPDVTFPIVVASGSADIETVEATEKELAVPLEERLRDLDGLKDTRTTVYPGRAIANLSFRVGTDLESATRGVQAALTKEMLKVDDVELDVTAVNLNESAAVSYAILSDEKEREELETLVANEIVPAIADLPDVARVDLLGAGVRESTNEPADADEDPKENLEGDDSPPTLVRFNGEDALAIQVIKQEKANTLEVVDRVAVEIDRLREEFPEIDIQLAATQADYIQEATQATIDALLGAIALAVLVIFIFLRNWQATLITALAIPISLLGTAIAMAWAGFNLETITLLALALTIGIIVDDAIVEVENIARHIEEGETPKQAALSATREIGLAVAASTLTIVAVFLPVAFMGGTIGQFFKPFGLTVSAAVLTSLLVARTLSPVLAVWWLRSPARNQPADASANSAIEPNSNIEADANGTGIHTNSSSEPVRHPGAFLEIAYAKLLERALDHRVFTIGFALLSLVAGLALIPFIPKGFVPQLDRGEFNITYTAPLPEIPVPAEVGGTPSDLRALRDGDGELPEDLPEEFAALRSADADLEDLEDSEDLEDLEDLENLEELPEDFAEEAFENGESEPSDRKSPTAQQKRFDPRAFLLEDSRKVAERLEEAVLEEPDVAIAYAIVGARGKPNEGQIYVRLQDERDRRTNEVQERLRSQLPELEGVTTSVEDIQFVELRSTKPLQIALLGDDSDALYKTAAEIKERAERLPELADVSATGESGEDGEEAKEIERLNGKRVAYVSANLAKGQALGNATDRVEEIAREVMPPEVTLALQGDSGISDRVFGTFGITLAFSVVCMLLVLLVPFGRLLEPLVVILSLPFAIVGAAIALLLTRSDFGMISLIGMIFLLGLLDKNALLLMDYANQLRRSGMERTQAILQTGLVRLRPILMTTASTILGMTPIALGFGAGAELRQPMAVAIIGGLITSTLLSLIVVPVLYALLEDIWKFLSDRARGKPKTSSQ